MIDDIIEHMRIMREMDIHVEYIKQCSKGVWPTKRAIAKGLYNKSVKAKALNYKLLHNRTQRHK